MGLPSVLVAGMGLAHAEEITVYNDTVKKPTTIYVMEYQLDTVGVQTRGNNKATTSEPIAIEVGDSHAWTKEKWEAGYSRWVMWSTDRDAFGSVSTITLPPPLGSGKPETKWRPKSFTEGAWDNWGAKKEIGDIGRVHITDKDSAGVYRGMTDLSFKLEEAWASVWDKLSAAGTKVSIENTTSEMLWVTEWAKKPSGKASKISTTKVPAQQMVELTRSDMGVGYTERFIVAARADGWVVQNKEILNSHWKPQADCKRIELPVDWVALTLDQKGAIVCKLPSELGKENITVRNRTLQPPTDLWVAEYSCGVNKCSRVTKPAKIEPDSELTWGKSDNKAGYTRMIRWAGSEADLEVEFAQGKDDWDKVGGAIGKQYIGSLFLTANISDKNDRRGVYTCRTDTGEWIAEGWKQDLLFYGVGELLQFAYKNPVVVEIPPWLLKALGIDALMAEADKQFKAILAETKIDDLLADTIGPIVDKVVPADTILKYGKIVESMSMHATEIVPLFDPGNCKSDDIDQLLSKLRAFGVLTTEMKTASNVVQMAPPGATAARPIGSGPYYTSLSLTVGLQGNYKALTIGVPFTFCFTIYPINATTKVGDPKVTLTLGVGPTVSVTKSVAGKFKAGVFSSLCSGHYWTDNGDSDIWSIGVAGSTDFLHANPYWAKTAGCGIDIYLPFRAKKDFEVLGIGCYVGGDAMRGSGVRDWSKGGEKSMSLVLGFTHSIALKEWNYRAAK